VLEFLGDELALALPLHRAQVSICYPGYPKPDAGEPETAFRYRLTRDAAHVDGLHAEGPARKRVLKEPHAFVLGLPLNESHPQAAPLVVWNGSHRIMRRMFEAIYGGVPCAAWPAIDATAAYQAARREVFATCRRVPLPARPGEAMLLHRHLLHGVAPWGEAAAPCGDGRIIAYFRPEFRDPRDWLDRS
jgi:hypothetical protein